MENLKSLIEELGLEGLPEKQKQDLTVSLAESLQIRISNRILVMLTEEEKEEFDKLTEKTLTEFIEKKIPNYDQILADEYLIFRKEILEDNQEILKLQKKQAK